MSGIIRGIFNYFFGRGKKSEEDANGSEVNYDLEDRTNGWSKYEQEIEKIGEDTCIRGVEERYGGLKGRLEWEKYSNKYGLLEYHKPEESNFPSVEKIEWKYENGDFAKSLFKAAGLEKSEEKCNDVHDGKNESPLHPNDYDISEEENASGSDSCSAEEKHGDHQEAEPFLPDLTSDESSDEDALKIDESSSREMLVEEMKEDSVETSAELKFPNDDLQVSASLSPMCHVDSGTQVPDSLPSMPELNSPGIETRFMTVIPLDKTMMMARSSESISGNHCEGNNITSFIVLTGSGCSKPIESKRAIEAPESKSDMNEDIPFRPTTECNQPKQNLSCKALTLGEMYERFNRGSLPSPHPNLGPARSPGNQIKKLMDVDRHSRLEYKPEANPSGTPPCSPASSDSVFHSTNSGAFAAGNGSPDRVNQSGRIPGTPQNSYIVSLTKRNDPGSVNATPNRKIILVKSKVDSGLAKIHNRQPVGGNSNSTSGPPACVTKKEQEKSSFATPESSASRSSQQRKVVRFWVGTPRPAPRMNLLGVIDSPARVASAQSGKPNDQHGASKSVTHLDRKRDATYEATSTTPTTPDGKRSSSTTATRDHGQPKKRKLDSQYDSSRRCMKRCRIPSSILNSPRSMRSRNSKITYKN